MSFDKNVLRRRRRSRPTSFLSLIRIRYYIIRNDFKSWREEKINVVCYVSSTRSANFNKVQHTRFVETGKNKKLLQLFDQHSLILTRFVEHTRTQENGQIVWKFCFFFFLLHADKTKGLRRREYLDNERQNREIVRCTHLL